MDNEEFQFAEAQKKPESNPDSISIGVLLYLITLGAIFAACVRTIMTDEAMSWEIAATASGVCAALGFILGGICGGLSIGTLHGILVGHVLGVCCGGLFGLFALVETQRFWQIAITVLLGCWTLLFIVAVSTRFKTSTEL